MCIAEVPAESSSAFVKAMREAADIMLSKQPPARAWHPPAAVDVWAIRTSTGLSQTGFARRFVSVQPR